MGFFRDMGKYINHFDFNANPRTISNFNDAIKHCTRLRSFRLDFLDVGGGADDNYEYRLPDSVELVAIKSYSRCIHTIRGAQVSRLALVTGGYIKVCGTMPNLSALKIDELEVEAIEGFKSLVKANRHLETVYIGELAAPVLTQITEILDHRVYIDYLMLGDISFVEKMVQLPATTMRKRGRVEATIKRDAAENTALLWHYLSLLLKKVPEMGRLRLTTQSPLSLQPEYAKVLGNWWYEVDLDRVKQRLLDSPE